LGELLWYLSGSQDLGFIEYYIPSYGENAKDGLPLEGAYGPRLLGTYGREHNQLQNVIDLLREKPSSRRAVIQLFAASDLTLGVDGTRRKDVPCTCSLQFLVRGGRLNLFATLRSNDVVLGLPHDIFTLTMIQELAARTLGLRLGWYRQAVGSLHLYDRTERHVDAYLQEGHQEQRPMSKMPSGDPWPSVRALLGVEQEYRLGQDWPPLDSLPPYWRDLALVLKAHRVHHERKRLGEVETRERILEIEGQFSDDLYRLFTQRRKPRDTRSNAQQQLLEFRASTLATRNST
jgi:thymidylate synthase